MDLELFPYKPRKGQKEVYLAVRNAVDNGKNLIINAPTGFGKTSVVLSSVLAEGKRVIWVSRTGNAINRVIEELKAINLAFDEDFSGISFRGKKDMCLRKEAKEADREAIKILCRNCELRNKVQLFKIATFAEILERCQYFGCCPYYSQINSAINADVVAMNYNYLFGESKTIIDAISSKEDVLVVDEAHNIVDAFNNNNSEVLSATSIARASREAILTGIDGSMAISKRIQKIFALVDSKELEGPLDIEEFLLLADVNEAFLQKIGLLASYIYEMQIKHGKAPRSYLGKLYRFFRKLMDAEEGQFLIAREKTLKFIDMRAGKALKEIWKNFSSVIAMSGTLKPVEDFKLISGLEDAKSVEIHVDYDKAEVIALRGVSTRGKELNKEMIKRYRAIIGKFMDFNGNVAIFTASYRIMDELKKTIEEIADAKGRTVFFESPEIGGSEAYELLDRFKTTRNNVLVGVCGGRFSEGVDFPGKALSALMLLGIPFERVEEEVMLRIRYYDHIFNGRGRYLGYILPAIRKASQAIGRLLRSPEDEGTIVLADERYLYRRYFELLPNFIRKKVKIMSYERFILR